MTDRVHTLTVVLKRDTRTDDIEALESAITQLRGVAKVSRHIADHTTHMAEERAKWELRAKLFEVLR